MTDLVDRLRARKNFWQNGGTWMMSAEPDPDCQEAAVVIERLRAKVEQVKENASEDIVAAEKEIERLRLALRQVTNSDEIYTAVAVAEDALEQPDKK